MEWSVDGTPHFCSGSASLEILEKQPLQQIWEFETKDYHVRPWMPRVQSLKLSGRNVYRLFRLDWSLPRRRRVLTREELNSRNLPQFLARTHSQGLPLGPYQTRAKIWSGWHWRLATVNYLRGSVTILLEGLRRKGKVHWWTWSPLLHRKLNESDAFSSASPLSLCSSRASKACATCVHS